MLLEWDRVNQSQTEIRQIFSRKLLELDESYNGPLEQKPDFKTLAKEIDIHGMLCINFKDIFYVSLIYSTTYKYNETEHFVVESFHMVLLLFSTLYL